jgi:HAD superfamily hydrolase (TIGR01509 family)
VFHEFGIPTSREQVAPLIGVDGRRLAREVAEAAERQMPAGGDEDIDKRCGEIYESLNRNPKPLPGATDLLSWLSEREVPWAIATSSRRDQVGTSVGALMLAREPTIVDGSHVEHAKPAPDLLLLAARELGHEPGECWCIGDSTWDARAAVAAGMPAVGITVGAAVDAEALTSAGATLVLNTLTDLQANLQRTVS